MPGLEQLYKELDFLGKSTIDRLIELGEIKEIPAESRILEEGQNVYWLPILISGRIRVYTRHEDKELLLYYILPGESCIMSFTAAIHRGQSRINAVTESDSDILLIPSRFIKDLVDQHAQLREMIFNLYQSRYEDLLDTIKQVVFHHMDMRILRFLKEEMEISGSSTIRLSHREIAQKLGTAREVVSRVLKKLESEGLLVQNKSGIRLLQL